MTKSIRKQSKRLRRKAKPFDPHAQSESYWPREKRQRESMRASWLYGGDLANPSMYKQ